MHSYEEVLRLAKTKEVHEEVGEIMECLIRHVEKSDPQYYAKYLTELEELAYTIPKEEAEKIVKAMRPRGQYWSYNQIMDYTKEKGIKEDCTSWYLVMNMVYNDYYDTAKLFGHQNDVEFFYCLAKDFIDDPDAKPFKVEKYFLDD